MSIEQGVRIWRRRDYSGYKCEVVVNAPSEIISRVLEVPLAELEWNPTIEKVSEHWLIIFSFQEQKLEI